MKCSSNDCGRSSSKNMTADASHLGFCSTRMHRQDIHSTQLPTSDTVDDSPEHDSTVQRDTHNTIAKSLNTYITVRTCLQEILLIPVTSSVSWFDPMWSCESAVESTSSSSWQRGSSESRRSWSSSWKMSEHERSINTKRIMKARISHDRSTIFSSRRSWRRDRRLTSLTRQWRNESSIWMNPRSSQGTLFVEHIHQTIKLTLSNWWRWRRTGRWRPLVVDWTERVTIEMLKMEDMSESGTENGHIHDIGQSSMWSNWWSSSSWPTDRMHAERRRQSRVLPYWWRVTLETRTILSRLSESTRVNSTSMTLDDKNVNFTSLIFTIEETMILMKQELVSITGTMSRHRRKKAHQSTFDLRVDSLNRGNLCRLQHPEGEHTARDVVRVMWHAELDKDVDEQDTVSMLLRIRGSSCRLTSSVSEHPDDENRYLQSKYDPKHEEFWETSKLIDDIDNYCVCREKRYRDHTTRLDSSW